MLIKTIIFDLGDVLMPVNREKAYAAFNLLGVSKAKELFESEAFQDLYCQLEKELDTAEFRVRLRELFYLHPSVTDQQIDAAWTAMLEDIPLERLDYIRELKERGYKILLLSNCNEIHHANIQQRYGTIFGEIFDIQYYSHLLKMAKPQVDIYKYVITTQAQEAQEFLFLDDKIANVHNAISVGLLSCQFTLDHHITEIDEILALTIRALFQPEELTKNIRNDGLK